MNVPRGNARGARRRAALGDAFATRSDGGAVPPPSPARNDPRARCRGELYARSCLSVTSLHTRYCVAGPYVRIGIGCWPACAAPACAGMLVIWAIGDRRARRGCLPCTCPTSADRYVLAVLVPCVSMGCCSHVSVNCARCARRCHSCNSQCCF